MENSMIMQQNIDMFQANSLRSLENASDYLSLEVRKSENSTDCSLTSREDARLRYEAQSSRSFDFSSLKL